MILLFLADALAGVRLAAQAEVVIRDVSVLGPDGWVTGPYDVRLAGGRIASVSSQGLDVDVPEIDGHGHTLMPGLVDAHVHIAGAPALPNRLPLPQPKRNLEEMLHHGVTAAFDAAAGRDCDHYVAKVEGGAWVGPRLFAAAGAFTVPGGHPVSSVSAAFPSPLVRAVIRHQVWEVDEDFDVAATLAAAPSCGFVKLMLDAIPDGVPVLDEPTARRIVEAAHARGDRAVAHVGSPDDVDKALGAGIDALVHTPYRGALRDEQIAALADRGIQVVTTLTVWQAVEEVHLQGPVVGPKEEESLTRAQERRFGEHEGVPLPGELGDWAESRVVGGWDVRSENVWRLYEHGVTLLIGSDGPGIGTVPGANLHRELALVEEAGVPRAAVLAAATWNNARFLDPQGTWGAMREGWAADLLLVRGDASAGPLEVVRVWKDGREVLRQ